MEELITYTSADLPERLKWQAVSFLRLHYPGGFINENRLRDWIANEADHPIHVVIVDEGILISHTGVVWRHLDHAGVTYKTYGLTAVFTYPSFQGHGYGSKVVAAGTDYILRSDADIAMLYCEPSLMDFYACHGWVSMDKSVSYIEEKGQPVRVDDEILMMLLISPNGQRGRAAFEHKPIYLRCDYTW